MKKLSYLLGLFLVTGMLFSSCSKDEDEEPVDLTPSINFMGGEGFNSTDVTITSGDVVTIGVNAQSNTTSGKKLTNFKLIFTSNNEDEVKQDSTFNKSLFTGIYPYILTGEGVVRIKAIITDKDNKKKEIAFNVTIEAASNPINTYTAVLMGGQTNTIGSFYSTGENQVLNVTEATDNNDKVDLVFFYGTNNANSIGAPNDDQVALAHEANGIGDWTLQNATLFGSAEITGLTWDEIVNDGPIIENASGLTVSLTSQLAVDQIFAFETASTSTNPSKMGLFKVIEIAGTVPADRAITIEVKIQQ